jgi:alanine racemase
MDVYYRPTVAEININALEHNIKTIRELTGDSRKIMAVVKADAYGHGVEYTSKVLLAAGADMLAVAFVDEAIALKKKGILADVLVLGYTPVSACREIIRYKITPVAYQEEFIAALSTEAQKVGVTVPVHVKVDTGMSRLGIPWQQAARIIETYSKYNNIEIEGICSHFSTADEKDKTYTNLQHSRFQQVISELEMAGLKIPYKHISNSAATMELSAAHYNIVRTGIMMYGLYPSEDVDHSIKLAPVMTLKTKIVHLKTIHKGDAVSYGNRFVATKDTKVATIPIGYADGYSRMLTGKIDVMINGQKAPVIGTICMDQCVVDVSHLEYVSLYDEVILFGDNYPVENLADALGTINYEIVCMLHKRIPKVYKKDGEIIHVHQELI